MQIFQKVKTGGMSICVSCVHRKVCKGIDNQPCVECNQFLNEDKKPQTNADRIRAMSDEELADFFFESPEIEFTVCEYCEYFGGHTSNTPCKHDMGRCLVPAKNEAFKKWLQQPAEEVHADG